MGLAQVRTSPEDAVGRQAGALVGCALLRIREARYEHSAHLFYVLVADVAPIKWEWRVVSK